MQQPLHPRAPCAWSIVEPDTARAARWHFAPLQSVLFDLYVALRVRYNTANAPTMRRRSVRVNPQPHPGWSCAEMRTTSRLRSTLKIAVDDAH